MAKQRRFKPQIKKVSILGASEFSEVTQEIPGSKGIVARTYGSGFHWRKVEVPSDSSLNSGRRDKFHARESLINGMKASGGFLYAVAWAESIKGHAAPKNPKGGIVKCAQCGALHRRVVFYRSVDGNAYLGHSGINCFLEILRNCGLDNAEAVWEHADKESKRIDKLRRIMGKINDFKTDFPGLYENREWLKSADNPYSQLWWEVLHQIVSTHRDGITEEWIQGTLDGSLDREYRVGRRSWSAGRLVLDQKGRRVFPWLKHVREVANKNHGKLTGKQIREACYDLAYTEVEGSPFRRTKPTQEESVGATGIASRTQRQPVAQAKPQAPAPAAQVRTEVQDKARVIADKGYGWSAVAKRAIAGEPLSVREVDWLRKVHKTVVSAVSDN